jgi:hypothetical protein
VGTIIVVFLLLVGLPVAAGVAVAARPLSSPKLIRRGALGALAVGVVLSAALLAFKSYHPVDAGHVGIVYGPSGSIAPSTTTSRSTRRRRSPRPLTSRSTSTSIRRTRAA